jgi:hypothetical protein
MAGDNETLISVGYKVNPGGVVEQNEKVAGSLDEVAGAQKRLNVEAGNTGAVAKKAGAEVDDYGKKVKQTGTSIRESAEKIGGVARILGATNPVISQMVSGFGGIVSLLGAGGPVGVAAIVAVGAFTQIKAALEKATKAQEDYYAATRGQTFKAALTARDELDKARERLRVAAMSTEEKEIDALRSKRDAAQRQLDQKRKDLEDAESVMVQTEAAQIAALAGIRTELNRTSESWKNGERVLGEMQKSAVGLRGGLANLKQEIRDLRSESSLYSRASSTTSEAQKVEKKTADDLAKSKKNLAEIQATGTLAVYEADLKASTALKGLIEEMDREGVLMRTAISLFSPYTSAIVTANQALWERWRVLSLLSGLPPNAGMITDNGQIQAYNAANGVQMDTGAPFDVSDFERGYREVPMGTITQLGVTGMEGAGAPMQDFGSVIPGAAGTALSGAGAALSGGGSITAAITAAAAAIGPGIIAAAVAAAATGFATVATAPFLVTGAVIGGLIQKGAIDALTGIPQAITDAVLADDPLAAIGQYFIDAVTNIEKMATNLDPVLIKVVAMLPTFIEKLGTAAISMLITTLTEAPYIVNSLIVGFGNLFAIIFDNLPALLQAAIPALVQGLAMLFVVAISSFPPLTLVLIGTTIASAIAKALIGMDWARMFQGLGSVFADTFTSIAAAIVAPLNAWIGSVESAIRATGIGITLPRIPVPERAGWTADSAANWLSPPSDDPGAGDGATTGPGYRSDIPWFHNGGWAGAMRAHRGMLVGGGRGLGADEVPIVAQTGERVLSRREVGAMGGPAAVDHAARGGLGGAAGMVLNFLTPDAARQFVREVVIPELVAAGQTGYLTANGLRFETP